MMQMKNTPVYRTHLGGMPEPGYYKTPSKVVSIPVHFVGSERNRTDSATKIQRLLRGFLVRNTLRKIAAMRVELERIESEIRVEVMKREQRERVRVSETIMNLLLKLDSVKVLHYSGLRECRKSLINKAIALQEMLDQMEEKESECVREGNCLVKEEEGNGMETLKDVEEEGECVGEDNCLVKEEEDNGMETLRNGEVETEKESGCMEEERLVEEIEALRNEEDSEGGTSFVEDNCLGKEDCEREEEKDGKKRELLEKMVEDNQKMMKMMAQMFQRNEMQTTLLTSLSQRVEQLERAFACDKLRRKKKRKADAKNHPKNGFF